MTSLSKNLRICPEPILFGTGYLRIRNKTGYLSYETAFSSYNNTELLIYVPRKLGTESLQLDCVTDSGDALYSLTGSFCMLYREYDVYSVILPKSAPGLYRFSIAFTTVAGRVFAVCNGVNGRFFLTSEEKRDVPPFRFLSYSPEYPSPSWLYGGIIYHIFVDRFCRAGETPIGDGNILNPDWDNGIPEYPPYPGAPLKNNTFFGGNLDGITSKLDYIKSLGVNCLYLSPIFEAASNHKYDTGDYEKVDSAFGGEAALMLLIKEAEKRGIGIILDGVFNHTGADSRYFNKFGNYPNVGAYQSPESPYYSWYDFQVYPDKYTAWWDIEILPRINPDISSCREYLAGEKGIVAHYMRKGIKGFRLDVADELSDDFIGAVKSRMNGIMPDSCLYGEVWEDASDKIAYGHRRAYYYGKELDGVMNYPLRTGILAYFRNRECEPLRYALTDIIANAPKAIRDLQMNLLGSHDTERVLTALAGEERGDASNEVLSTRVMSAAERALAVCRLKLAYLTVLTLPGVPSIFYGDEAGMEGYGDPFNRRPYPWKNRDEKLLSYYRYAGQMRVTHRIYEKGDFRLLVLEMDTLIFERFDDVFSYVTLINNGDTPMRLTLPKDAKAVFSTDDCGNRETVLPFEGAVYKLPRNTRIIYNRIK